MKAFDVLKYPINTEKAVRIIEMENKLTFIVDRKASKTDIKNAAEEIFKVKVIKVNAFIGWNGKKKAFIKLDPSTPAMDVITKLGVM